MENLLITDPEHLIQTQKLEPILHENSYFYVFSKTINKKRQNRLQVPILT